MLRKEDKYTKFTRTLRSLMGDAIQVDDTFVLEPVDVVDACLTEANQIPFNFTALGSHVVVSGGSQSMEMRNKKRDKKGEAGGAGGLGEEEEKVWENPEVYFTLAFLCDKDPEKLLKRISCEWGKRRQSTVGERSSHF